MRIPESRHALAPALSMLLAGCLLGAAAPASAAKPLLTVKVDASTTATVTRADGNHVLVRLSPDNTTQKLEVGVSDEDGNTQYGSGDYNFDGHQDLAFSATLGMVNERYQVYLFDAASRRFVPLGLAPGSDKLGNCGDLTNLDAKPAEHTLYSSCRSGPIWYTDAYRYRADGVLYLYQASRELPQEVQDLVDGKPDDGPASLLVSHDASGKVIGRKPQAYGGGEARITVAVPKLALHDGPHEGPTRRYVVAGDKLALVGANDAMTWLQVRFSNPRAGAIVGWIKVSEASAPAQAAAASGTTQP
ncbi:hypothetical protein DX980_24650 [Burkholderia gladioli]|jgi:hypothetical protein|uniref:XAC2610-related protein n=1 Tax=Burkholderia gladioli TaxID=28095 RepID=UPI001364AFEC|nr:hypothetical protein [Burkholderia gladioli]KAF1058245.1 hypothetical protein LvStA_04840 [Burkholderia gladioli]WAG22448.1 hypothetical protein DX980_24650 [Burkholderia gladioli]